jgi:hypothetical protein
MGEPEGSVRRDSEMIMIPFAVQLIGYLSPEAYEAA